MLRVPVRCSVALARNLGAFRWSVGTRPEISTRVIRRSSSSNSNSNGWLWPLDYAATMLTVGHDVGTRFGPVSCTINSSKPVHPDLVEDALMHLIRKDQCLRLTIQEKDGQLWYREVNNAQFEMKVLEQGTDVMDVIERYCSQKIQCDAAPLCKIYMIPLDNSAPCHIPGVKEKFPHQFHIILHNHHGLFDGPSFASVIQAFLDVLDDILDGKTVDDTKPIGIFNSGKEIIDRDLEIQKQFEENPHELEKIQRYLSDCNRPPVLLRAFPPPEEPDPTTRFIYRVLEPRVFKTIYVKAKENHVSFNTVLGAAINTSIVELVKEAGIPDEEFHISIAHATDLRRYMSPSPQMPMGLHVRSTAQLVHTKADVRKDFWNYARYMHNDMNELLKSDAALKHEVARQMTLPIVSPKDFYKNPQLSREYGITNIGNLSRGLPGVGRNIQLTGLLLLAYMHKFLFPTLHQTYTFRDGPIYTFSYGTDCMTQETAELVVNKISSVLTDIIL